MYKLILISLFLTSCLSPLPDEEKLIDYDLNSINIAKDRFYSEFPESFKLAEIYFTDKPYTGRVANCYQTTGKIEIFTAIWKDLQPVVREAVIFHELVHCELGLGHFGTNLMSDFLGFIADAYVNRYEESILEIRSNML